MHEKHTTSVTLGSSKALTLKHTHNSQEASFFRLGSAVAVFKVLPSKSLPFCFQNFIQRHFEDEKSFRR